MPSANKGKGRADERTPLLGSPSGGSPRSRRAMLRPDEGTVSRRERICSHVLTALLAVFSLLFLAVLFFTLISRPAAPSPAPEQLFEQAVHFKGPYSIEVLNITDPLTTPDHVGGIWLRVDGDIYVDSDLVLREMANSGVQWWTNIRLGVGRWLVRTIQHATVDLGTLELYDIHAEGTSPPLARVRMPEFIVPLEPNVTYSGAPYSPFSLPVLISPTRDVGMLAEFAAESWKAKALRVKVKSNRASVYGGDQTGGHWGWRTLLGVTVNKFKKNFAVPIPELPGLPAPGGKLPPVSSLITLLGYALSSTSSGQISISANASFVNVFPALNLPSAFSMVIPETPIVLSLPVPLPGYSSQPEQTPFAIRGSTPPPVKKPTCIDLHNGTKPRQYVPTTKYLPLARMVIPPQQIPPPDTPDNITIAASGQLIPLRATQQSMEAVSPFLSAYLAGESYDVLVTIDLPIVSSPGTGTDEMIDPGQTLSVHVEFPAVKPKPHVLQELTIRDMRIHYRQTLGAAALSSDDDSTPPPIDLPIFEHANEYQVLASGTVYAHVVLPSQFDVEANVTKVWPDVILYDGQIPPENDTVSTGPMINISAKTSQRLVEARPPAPTHRAFSGRGAKQKALDAVHRDWYRYDGCSEPLPPYEPTGDKVCVHRPPRPVPMPDPLPENAFARIRTSDWLDAVSQPQQDEEGKRVVVVQAQFEDVPVTVLPGREGKMRSFVSKAIFSTKGADAGIDGIAAVATIIPGLVAAPRTELSDNEHAREIELHGLPVRGNVRVGGKLVRPVVPIPQ